MVVTSRGHWTTKLTWGQDNLWEGVHRLRESLLLFHCTAHQGWVISYFLVSAQLQHEQLICVLASIRNIHKVCYCNFISQKLNWFIADLVLTPSSDSFLFVYFISSFPPPWYVSFNLLLIPSCTPLFSLWCVYFLTRAVSQPFNGLI